LKVVERSLKIIWSQLKAESQQTRTLAE